MNTNLWKTAIKANVYLLLFDTGGEFIHALFFDARPGVFLSNKNPSMQWVIGAIYSLIAVNLFGGLPGLLKKIRS